MGKKLTLAMALGALSVLASSTLAAPVTINSFGGLGTVTRTGDNAWLTIENSAGHYAATYSAAVIQFVGSGGTLAYGGLSDVAVVNQTNTWHSITIAAATGYELLLQSFTHTDGIGSGGPTGIGVHNVDQPAPSASMTAGLWAGPTTGAGNNIPRTFTLGGTGSFTLADLQKDGNADEEGYREIVTLIFKTNVNRAHGIDDITFDVRQVPEPGALSLLGLASLAMLRRRRMA